MEKQIFLIILSLGMSLQAMNAKLTDNQKLLRAAQTVSGQGVIDGLKKDTDITKRGVLLVAQMSCAGNLITPEYTKRTIELAEKNNDFAVGFICQEQCSCDPGMIHLTPGVNINAKKDALGQQFRSPDYLIKECKTDGLIVGRGIYQAEDCVAAVKEYKDVAWKAYQERINS